SSPQGGQPVKHFNCRRYGDNQGRDQENRAQEWVHTRYEHVVSPYQEGKNGNSDQRSNHGAVSENRLPGMDGKELRGYSERRENNDIHFGVTQEPEKVLEKNRAATGILYTVGHTCPYIRKIKARSYASIEY